MVTDAADAKSASGASMENDVGHHLAYQQRYRRRLLWPHDRLHHADYPSTGRGHALGGRGQIDPVRHRRAPYPGACLSNPKSTAPCSGPRTVGLMSGPQGWWRTVVAADRYLVDLCIDALWAEGPAAVEEQDAGDVTRLLAGYPDRASAARAAAATTALGATAHAEAVTDDGLDQWRAHARPVRAGRFLVIPDWLEGQAATDPAPEAGAQVPLLIDPRRTFGSGSHPTTRLCLAAVDDLVEPGARVLDVGCGSGILGIAAALIGATTVLGVDVDAGSPAATEANAAANRVEDRVAATTDPLRAVVAAADRPFDLVLANLLAPTIDELAEPLVAALAPGGHLVASGLLAESWADAVEPLRGLRTVSVLTEQEWVAVILARA